MYNMYVCNNGLKLYVYMYMYIHVHVHCTVLRGCVCVLMFTVTGPLTSFLDLTKPPQFTAYSSESAAGGRAPPKPRPTATPTVSGNSRHKRALFSDAEIKLLRYTCTYVHVQ